MKYPEKRETVDILLNAAARAAENSNCVHPEDIANEMVNAIDNVAPSIMDAFHLK